MASYNFELGEEWMVTCTACAWPALAGGGTWLTWWRRWTSSNPTDGYGWRLAAGSTKQETTARLSSYSLVVRTDLLPAAVHFFFFRLDRTARTHPPIPSERTAATRGSIVAVAFPVSGSLSVSGLDGAWFFSLSLQIHSSIAFGAIHSIGYEFLVLFFYYLLLNFKF